MSPDVDAIRAYLTAITNPWRELEHFHFMLMHSLRL